MIYNSFFHTEVYIVVTIFMFIVGIHPFLAVVIITLDKGGSQAKWYKKKLISTGRSLMDECIHKLTTFTRKTSVKP